VILHILIIYFGLADLFFYQKGQQRLSAGLFI